MVIGTWSRAWVAAAILGGVVTGKVSAHSRRAGGSHPGGGGCRDRAAGNRRGRVRTLARAATDSFHVAETAYLERIDESGPDVSGCQRRGAYTLAVSHPLDGARVEYESSGALSVFDRGGTRRNPRLSTEASGASMGSPGAWLDELVFTAAGTPARRLEVDRAYRPGSRRRGKAPTLPPDARRRHRGRSR